MIQITLVAHDGTTHPCVAQPGSSLMQAAVEAGIPGIVGECGGSCACATCHVLVEPGWGHLTGSPTPDEDALLATREDRESTSRLACQIRLNGGMNGLVVRLPASQF